MPRGGARLGAGRPKGPPGAKKAADIAALVVETMKNQAKSPAVPPVPPPPPPKLPESLTVHYSDPLDFLTAVMNEPKVPLIARQDAAKALMPFKHAKKGETGKKEAAADTAKRAAGGKFGAATAPPRLAVNNA